MTESSIKKNRAWAYNILINEYEPTLRKVLIEKILIPNFGIEGWKKCIPSGVFDYLNKQKKEVDTSDIYVFFDELFLLSLKEIFLNKLVYQLCDNIFNEMSKDIFNKIFDELNEIRRKVAHAKASFSNYDFKILIENLKKICNKDTFGDFLQFIEYEKYKNFDYTTIPSSFFIEEHCINNLPVEDYVLDGGFIGRKEEIETVKKLLYSELDRIISVTGAGGLGKTALALNIAHNIVLDEKNPYTYIIWLSAKENKLTAENGIVNMESQISDYSTLLTDILDVVSPEYSYDDDFEDFDLSTDIYHHFSEFKCLLIIDNLETITDVQIINFIKDIPRPSQVLITSRRGLGEIERRYPLPDFKVNDAIALFRIISKEKNKIDLLRLREENIKQLVTSVKCYPLLIKWSIGKTCLGMDINKAFHEIYSGKSEISQFVFNDTFDMLNQNSKQILYAMNVYGSKPISLEMLKHFVNFDDFEFGDRITDLIVCSFIFTEVTDTNGHNKTQYNMLSLTRGFIQTKLDEEDPSVRIKLQEIYHEIQFNTEETEKSFLEFNKSIDAFGLKTDEDKLAFNYIKAAKNFLKQENFNLASKNFEKAISIAPDLSYTINEVAKYEDSIGHVEKAEELLKRGISKNKNSLILSSYGIFLRKHDRNKEAIHFLIKALDIDPKNPRTIKELGRTYSFIQEFQNANDQYEKALNSQYLDFKQKRITMYFQADNYHRWGEKLANEGDIKSFIEHTNKALKLVDLCLGMNKYDKRVTSLKSKLYKDLGIKYLKINNLALAEDSFDQVFKLDVFHDKCISIREFFKYHSRISSNPKERIQYWLDKARTSINCSYEKEEYVKLLTFIERSKKIKSGKIRFLNINKGFGVIDYEPELSCTFIFRNAKFFIDESSKDQLADQEVFFFLSKFNGKPIAINVELSE